MRRHECLRHLLASNAVVGEGDGGGGVGVGDVGHGAGGGIVGVGGGDAARPGAGGEAAVGGVGVGGAEVVGVEFVGGNDESSVSDKPAVEHNAASIIGSKKSSLNSPKKSFHDIFMRSM